MCLFTGTGYANGASFTWREIQPNNRSASLPPARRFHAMGYFAQIEVLVIFGGRGANGLLNDTWVFDFVNGNWTQVSYSIDH